MIDSQTYSEQQAGSDVERRQNNVGFQFVIRYL
jgi:hypothetical protein